MRRGLRDCWVDWMRTAQSSTAAAVPGTVDTVQQQHGREAAAVPPLPLREPEQCVCSHEALSVFLNLILRDGMPAK